jgi:hypothetical protein
MKIFTKAAFAAAAALCAPSMANAAYLAPNSSIQFSGYLTASGAPLFLDSSQFSFNFFISYGFGSGDLSPVPLCFGTCGSIQDVSFTGSGGTPAANPFITFTLNNGVTPVLTFKANSISALAQTPATNSLSFTATGLLTYLGVYDPTPATLSFSSQTANPHQLVGDSFSGSITALAVPEASSWALMIVGLAGVGGAMRRVRARPAFA